MSVILTIDFASVTQDQVVAAQAMLAAYDKAAIRTQIREGQFEDVDLDSVNAVMQAKIRELENKDAERRPVPSQLPVEIPCPVLPAAETCEEKPKRGRPRKNAVEPTSAVEPEPAAADPVAGSPVLATEVPPTQDELRTALKALTEKAGDLLPGINLLKEFGCTRVPELCALPAAKQHEFITRCSIGASNA